MTKQTLTEAIERGKQEIVEDMHSGRVPADVVTFRELHDYVDANEYAGLTEMDLEGDALAHTVEFGNALQDAIDEWLRLGWLARIARMDAQDRETGARAWRVTVLVDGEAVGTYEPWADDEWQARTRAIRQHTDTHQLFGRGIVDYDVVDLSDEPTD